MSDSRRTCKALTNPTREYTPDMVREMLGKGTLSKAAPPNAPTMALNVAGNPPPAPMDPAYTLVDDPEELPTHQLSADRAGDMRRLLANVVAPAGMPDGPSKTASTVNITGGRPNLSDQQLAQARRSAPPMPAALPGMPPVSTMSHGGAVPAPRQHIARGSTPPPPLNLPFHQQPQAQVVKRTLKANQGHGPAALAQTHRQPQLAPIPLAATQPAPAHAPTPPGMRINHPGMMHPAMMPPPAHADHRHQARAMRIRPPSTISDRDGVPTTDAQRQTAKQAATGKRKGIGVLSVLFALVLAAGTTAAGIALNYLEPSWWLALAAVALLPAISLTITRFASRLLAWIRVPRPVVVVLAAVFGSVTLLGSAFLVSWAVGAGSVPAIDELARIPQLLSSRLEAVTGLHGPQLMAWWAGLLLAVTMAASLGAARISGYRR